MSVGKALITGSITRVSQTLVSILIAFFMMPFLVADLGTKWYGIWAMIGSLTAAYHLFDMGMAGAVTRYLAHSLSTDDEDKANQIINTSLIMYLIIALVIALVSLAISNILFLFPIEASDQGTIKTLIIIVGLSVALEFPFNSFAGVANAKLMFHQIALIRVVTSIINALAIWYVVSAGYGIIAIALVSFVTARITNICYFAVCKKAFPGLKISFSKARMSQGKELFGYRIWAFMIALVAVTK